MLDAAGAPGRVLTLGIGDMGLSARAKDSIRTFALGSCVAVVLWDPVRLAGAMAHVALPDSRTEPGKGRELPGYFADTALPALVGMMGRIGCLDPRGLVVKLAGGANVSDAAASFGIGKRNVLAVKKVLWGFGLGPMAEDVGGSISRTVELEMATGKLAIHSPGLKAWAI